MTSYTVPRRVVARHETEIKRSRFIGYATRADDEAAARAFLAEIRAEHREARHVCHAFVIGPRRDVQRSSDDGEPAGTAGVPILSTILERPGKLSDVAVAVVRYFGGVKLGAGGLVQAYSGECSAVLDELAVIERGLAAIVSVQVDYALAARLETLVRADGYRVSGTNYEERGVVLGALVPPDDLDEFASKVAAWTSGAAGVTRQGECWTDWSDVS